VFTTTELSQAVLRSKRSLVVTELEKEEKKTKVRFDSAVFCYDFARCKPAVVDRRSEF
jgi:hypothetical protein